ncbi:hypothetical protein [Desulforamulus aquiferis]|uniref:Spore coat protein n=1 Tax=Desulforamulus aquiferis TaxID=1397668 RepID=A0AAW7ZAR6_9FIRM|nr:hypothetical protein [Desulforamulus aquiferis]MDO7786496.1 hypothetical protein [Desulforamulus aquiferis]
MGYGFGPWYGAPVKKPVQEQPKAKPPVQEKQPPKKQEKKYPQFPFNFGPFMPNKNWNKK